MFSQIPIFGEQLEYEGRVFLRSYDDALQCLKQTAERQNLSDQWERQSNRILLHVNQLKMFKNSTSFADNDKDIKMFQFTHFVFLNYFSTLDQFDGKYEDLKKMLDDGRLTMQNNLDKAFQKQ